MTIDEVTVAVIVMGRIESRDWPRSYFDCALSIALRKEMTLAIAGDCVSAFRLRAARLRLQAAIKERP